MNKSEMLKILDDKVKDCKKCYLHECRKQTVFGEGSPDALVTIIAEAPGQQEDDTGRPFVGPAGVLLDEIIGSCGWKREDIYICNVVKCRPPMNRAPTINEAVACTPYLELQIQIINSPYIICLGKTAANYFLLNDLPISSLRGKLHLHQGRTVLCTYHPSFLLRKPEENVKVWSDMQLLLAFMEKNKHEIIPVP